MSETILKEVTLKYPYKITVPAANGIQQWLVETAEYSWSIDDRIMFSMPDHTTRTVVRLVSCYFSNESDATLFKLKWG